MAEPLATHMEEILEAIKREKPSHLFAMFSGGHDSMCSTYLASQMPGFSGVIHCNTGRGIKETRDYVYETCERFDWPLHELHPETSYEDLVLNGRISKKTDRLIQGFPYGDMGHKTMLWHLKQKPLLKFVRGLNTNHRVGLVSGARKEESSRRKKSSIAVPVRLERSHYLWPNPILDWNGLDKSRYMAAHDLPRNPVVDALHKSGECLCGAMARRAELKEIAFWYPDAAKPIIDLEAEAKRRGITECFWAMHSPVGAGQGELEIPPEDLLQGSPLCTSCQRPEENLEEIDEWLDVGRKAA